MNARIQRMLLIAQLAAGTLIAAGLWIGMGLPVIAAVALGLVAAFGFQPMLIGIEFLMAAAVSDAPAQGRVGPLGWLRAWLGECVAAARTFSVVQPLLSGRPLASAHTDCATTHLPVLLVHGYFCNRAMWRPLAARLAQSGHVVDAVNLEPSFAPIDDYVAQIDAGVRRLQAATGVPRVALIGHSMGGLAIRAWLRASGDEAMACVVTLGTPHAGTLHADFGRAANVQQMRRNSAWLQSLAARLAQSGHVVDAVNLEPSFAPIDDYVAQIDAGVRRLQAATGAPRVALIGHSMGGLAIRAWLRAAGDEAMACVVTLGTPHAGTLHADFGRAANVQQMRRNSAWLQSLAASEPADRLRRFTVIRSWQDNIVAPQGPQTLHGARTVSFTGIGHVRLVYDRKVARAALDALQAAARDAT